jgi:hypothetical protein
LCVYGGREAKATSEDEEGGSGNLENPIREGGNQRYVKLG